MSKSNERDVPSQLFGAIRRPDCTGGHLPTLEDTAKLAIPPEPKFGKVHVFCAGCGWLDIINQAGGEELSRRAGIPTPTDWPGKYFQVQSCIACVPSQGFNNPELKEVRLS